MLAAFAARGLTVSPHKVGPDYIDPGYHGLAAGRPGRNLDPWLTGEERIAPLFLHGARGADIAVVEGNAEEAQDALRHVPEADPDPVWRCKSCGTVHGAWHPICDACESVGSIAWGQPVDAAHQQPRLAQPEPIEGLTS